MSNGQLLFYGGVGLMAFTVLLAVLFWIKKPQYIPSSTVYDDARAHDTQKLRSAYPTAGLTKRWKGKAEPAVEECSSTPAARLNGTLQLSPQANTMPMAEELQGTLPLVAQDETMPLAAQQGNTMPLSAQTETMALTNTTEE